MEYLTWLVSLVVGERHIGLWALALLAYHLLYVVGLPSLPLVTGLTVVFQTAIYARWLPVPWNSPLEVCLSAHHIQPHRQWRRLLLAQVEHVDDWHLYNNMVSFLWKAIQLENDMGSAKFGYVLALLLVLCGVIEVGLAFILSWASGNSKYIQECGVGFSGVIFALKVLKNVAWFGQAQAFPAWYAWYELLETMILAPQSSFMGHLAGLLAGTAYVCHFQYNPPSFAPVSALISAAFIRALPSSWDAMIQSPCLSADSVLNRGDWKQLFLSPLYSYNDLHAAYAFVTMMFLGHRYERSKGSARFAIRVLSMTAATGLLYCWLARKLAEFDLYHFKGVFGYEMEYKCFSGATAAILALKRKECGDRVVNKRLQTFADVLGLRRRDTGRGQRSLVFGAHSPGPLPGPMVRPAMSPLLGALLEAVFLGICFPLLWTLGHTAGIAAGIIYAALLFLLEKLAEAP
ncbi:hypothetical protein HPB48_012966 [Haemaphysalis longicornis]|uniref:Peptidase S54 rhomboid domain-containing protein n=1 Tax=Haemaphysalis longicornis TaxID=44386 RepID=A0A9J6FS79_HAELO|nr:hypothetical protein HPB48_012966 [Haemaphysalis longicornis]